MAMLRIKLQTVVITGSSVCADDDIMKKTISKESDMSVGILDHYNLRTRKFDETVRFYVDILGLENGPRPNFNFPGAWLYSDGRAIVHLVDLSPTSEPQKPDSGVVHHVAFISRGFQAMKERLRGKGVTFDSREVPGGDVWQIFIRDPNGVMIELNYEMAKEAV
jgi:catechol 2,3-dioxygenase-like lactoylglutathione lyase family enzyme